MQRLWKHPVFLAPILALVWLGLAGGANVHAQGTGDGSDPWLEATIEIEPDGRGSAVLRFLEPVQLPSSLLDLAEKEEDSRREVLDGGTEVILHFAPRELEEVARLFSDLSSDRSGITVLIRVPEELLGGDIWRFQADLSRERLRRVRIVTGT